MTYRHQLRCTHAEPNAAAILSKQNSVSKRARFSIMITRQQGSCRSFPVTAVQQNEENQNKRTSSRWAAINTSYNWSIFCSTVYIKMGPGKRGSKCLIKRRNACNSNGLFRNLCNSKKATSATPKRHQKATHKVFANAERQRSSSTQFRDQLICHLNPE